jgi:hypothetical protein
MNKNYVVFFLFFVQASCKMIEKKANSCFSCNVVGKDSCDMTDNCAIFVSSKIDTIEVFNLSRCGAGMLRTVQFNYLGYSNYDSALIKVTSDNSASYLFPVKIPRSTKEKNDLEPSLHYRKDTYFELPISEGISFRKYCTVTFVLRSGVGSGNLKASVASSFQHIFLQWIPQTDKDDESNVTDSK